MLQHDSQRILRAVQTVALIVLTWSVSAAQKWDVQRGTLAFTSNAPLEMIKATSDGVQGTIDTQSQNFAFLVPIRSFVGFNSELQRQHFNENYMQSDQYPRATFAGKIIEAVDFSRDSVYAVRAKGDLDVHGVKQTRIIRSRVTVNNGRVTIQAEFRVPLADHNITIPKIVNQKIATEIDVIFTADLVNKK